MARQYVAVRFFPRGRSYTYHNDGPPVEAGDKVRIEGRDGWQAVTVDTVTYDPPRFETKPIGPKVQEGMSMRTAEINRRNGTLFDQMDEDVQSLMDRDRE